MTVLKISSMAQSNPVAPKQNREVENSINWNEDSNHIISKSGAQALRNNTLIGFGLTPYSSHSKIDEARENLEKKDYGALKSNIIDLKSYCDGNNSIKMAFFRDVIDAKPQEDNKEFDKILIKTLDYFVYHAKKQDEERLSPLLRTSSPQVLEKTVDALIECYMDKHDDVDLKEEFNKELDNLSKKLEPKNKDNNNMINAVVNANLNIELARENFNLIYDIDKEEVNLEETDIIQEDDFDDEWNSFFDFSL